MKTYKSKKENKTSWLLTITQSIDSYLVWGENQKKEMDKESQKFWDEEIKKVNNEQTR